MSNYDNTNRFVLFRNDRKEEERDPDFKGTINIKGVDHWFDAWATVEDKRLTRINGRIGKEKQARGGGQQQRNNNNNQRSAPPPSGSSGFDDDDIPFQTT